MVRLHIELTGKEAGLIEELTYVIYVTPDLEIGVINLGTAFVYVETAQGEVKVKRLEYDGLGQHFDLTVLESHLDLRAELAQDILLGRVILGESLQTGGTQAGCQGASHTGCETLKTDVRPHGNDITLRRHIEFDCGIVQGSEYGIHVTLDPACLDVNLHV